MKTESEVKLIKATGAINAIIHLLEIEDSVFGTNHHEVKIKYLDEIVDDINQVLKDEHEPITS